MFDTPEPQHSSGIRDNRDRGRVGDFLRSKIREGSRLSVVSAYFTIYAFDALREHLLGVNQMDFLFGEPSSVRSLDPCKTEAKAYMIDDDGLELARRLEQKRVAKECANWVREKVNVRSVKRAGFVHGKMYHVASGDIQDVIIGSSNFTVRGLGLAPSGGNIELNLVVDSNRDVRDLKAWFDEMWNDPALVEDVKEEVLRSLDRLYSDRAPEFIYYKTLYHIFEKYLSDNAQTKADLEATTLLDSGIWKQLFEFQRDGAKGAINKILSHNGCVLADSVGLGKTFEALAVIKYFELRNERVLVLCPKKLRDNWTVYTQNDQRNPFLADRFSYDVLSHTDLSRDTGMSGDINLAALNWGNYNLVVIDESHNFRNNTPGRRDEEGNIVKKSRYQRLVEDVISNGVKTKVLMLSATPVNNTLKDLRNQLGFITAGSDSAFEKQLGIGSLVESLRKAQEHFTKWSRQKPEARKTADLISRLGADFFRLLDGLTIARSRQHIRKYYQREMSRLGGFPTRAKPIAIYPDIDTKGLFLSYDRLSDEISGYKLSIFNPSQFVLPKHRAEYEEGVAGFKQSQREGFLIGMMKVNFLKRLESSVHSFELTLKRTIDKITDLEDRLTKYKQYREQNPELDPDSYEPDYLDDDELRDAFEVGQKKKFKVVHLNVDGWLEELHRDKKQLNGLYLHAKDVGPDRDAKLAELKKLISAKVRQPSINRLGNPNRKVLVFTAFADTAKYLYEQLHSWAREELGVHAALVVGTGENQSTFQPKGYSGQTDYANILINFAPHSKERDKIGAMPQSGEIDLLIASDCISEGQNLQDCDHLINYDIHWNPVRIIQRFGRIDRIGSLGRTVQLVNFWPTQNLDRYITLKTRVEARMALVDLAATMEDNLLEPEDIQDLITEDLQYRHKQLVRMRDEVLDLEDLKDDNISLTEFTLDDFRMELLRYIEANRAQLEEAPLGLYAVVPPDPQYAVIEPGVVFCFRQRNGACPSVS
ncbi:ATP-dependent helicase [candidate division WOR-3 bacterium]|uniref:ATP-dependent helicase n=1 Tax=candidate division WOR-3 bacterium TaxID=2052148 RepID=A0A937XFI9_UNCW3|nr:ATP-dependent helicase [candidate division WOR-3 bacterium]